VNQFLGVDIGGANIKTADGHGHATSLPFPLWQCPEKLPAALRQVIAAAPHDANVVATMTGELADCFATKDEGVRAIVDALCQAAESRRVLWYTLDGTFVTSQVAKERSQKVAAANWHALARFAATCAPSPYSLLLDVGSTTTDIIPLIEGRPATRGFNDPERLSTGELVYTGVQRTPVCAMSPVVPWRGRPCRVAGELFATAWDVYLTLNQLPEEPEATHTADGRPATRSAAARRLARSICADQAICGADEVQAIAHALATAQRETLSQAAREVVGNMPQQPRVIVVSGQGEFLALDVARCVVPEANLVSLNQRLGPNASSAAAAHALAAIAMQEGIGQCE